MTTFFLAIPSVLPQHPSASSSVTPIGLLDSPFSSLPFFLLFHLFLYLPLLSPYFHLSLLSVSSQFAASSSSFPLQLSSFPHLLTSAVAISINLIFDRPLFLLTDFKITKKKKLHITFRFYFSYKTPRPSEIVLLIRVP